MWCPPEYIHLHEVEEACELAARRIVPYESGKEFLYIDDDKIEYDYENSNEFRRLVVQGKLLELFFYEYRYNSFAASLSGQIVRLSHHIVRPVIFNHWTKYEKIFSRRPALLYVNLETAKIDIAGVAARFVDWNGKDGYEDVGVSWEARAFNEFGELDGWSVCYSKNEATVSSEYFIEIWQTHCRRQRIDDGSPQPGRPRRQEEAAEAFFSLYPNGRGSSSWKEVLNKLNAIGISVSLKTLQRAIGQKS